MYFCRQPEKLIVRTDSYQRRHVSPPRRGASPPAKGSGGGRSEANDRFGATRSGERGGMSSRPFDDRDRRDGGRINGNGDSFRGGDRLPPGDFGRRESGRGRKRALFYIILASFSNWKVLFRQEISSALAHQIQVITALDRRRQCLLPRPTLRRIMQDLWVTDRTHRRISIVATVAVIRLPVRDIEVVIDSQPSHIFEYELLINLVVLVESLFLPCLCC